MNTIQTRPGLSSTWLQAPLQIESALSAGADRVLVIARGLEARWEANARQALATRQLRSLNERELHDIGISRGDIPRVAREASFER